MPTLSTLKFTGYRTEPLNNVFSEVDSPSGSALVLPGMGYGLEYAGLNYSIALLNELGFNTLALQSRYATPEFKALSESEAVQWLHDDASGALAALAPSQAQRFCLLGKSIGTLGMAALVAAQELPENAQFVWLTPLLQRERVYSSLRKVAARSLIVIGTADPAYDASLLKDLEHLGAEVVVLKGGQHNLMVEDDATQSAAHLTLLLERTKAFLMTNSL